MPYPPRKSTGKGVRTALLLGVGLIAIMLAFSTNYAETQYITFPYDGGSKIGTAFYYRSPVAVSRPAPVIIFFHGYNSLKTYDFRLLEFTRRGWDVLSVDLPGHGSNINNFTTGCWKVIFGAVDYVETRPEWWNASAIGVVGHSFGGLVCAMGLLNDPRIAAGVLWAPLLNMTELQGRADSLFPYGHPFDRFNAMDSPVTYLQSGMTLNKTLIIHGTGDLSIPISVNLHAYGYLEFNDSGNKTHHSFETINGETHGLYNDRVIRDSISWFATYLDPENANQVIHEVETTPMVYWLFLMLEIGAIFGLVPAIFTIFVDQVGKSVERKRWEAQLQLGIQEDEYPLATPAINRNWKRDFTFYIIALILIIFVGVNVLEFLPFHYQLGFMGLLMTGTAVLFEYLRHHWTVHKLGSPKRVEEAEDLAEELINPWPRRVRRSGKGVLLGLALGGTLLLGLSALTYDFGFFFVFPISVPYFIVSLIAAFAFSFGIEWLFRRRIQVLINEVEPYYKRRTIKILSSLLMFVLPSVIVLGLVRFAAVITPTAYFLFYTAAGLCPVINWFLFDHTKSLIPTVTFSTLVLGWILAGCLTPAFF